MPTFRVKKLHPEAKLPQRAHNTDSGLDLYAFHPAYFPPNTRKLIGTGISIEIPNGYGGFITPRSGLAIKNGLTVLNTPGLIDSGYRGEVGVILFNSGQESVTIFEGDKIAQLVIISTPLFEPVEVPELNNTKRGEGGFGSTDVVETNKLQAYNYEDAT